MKGCGQPLGWSPACCCDAYLVECGERVGVGKVNQVPPFKMLVENATGPWGRGAHSRQQATWAVAAQAEPG